VLSFIPPAQIPTGSPTVYVLVIAAGVALFFAVPFIVFAFRKDTWKDPTTTFEPFDWQIEGREPSQVSQWPNGVPPAK
jgi:hypothetical protein